MEKLKSSFGFYIYLAIISLLTLGMCVHSGVNHLDKILLVTTSFIVFYFLQRKFLWKKEIVKKEIPDKYKDIAYYLLVSVCLGIFLIDIIVLRGLPGFQIFSITSEVDANNLRNNIHLNSNTIIVYLNSFNLKVFFPLAILFSIIKKHNWLFAILTIIGSIYCFGLLQKGLILSMLLPVLIYFILNKKILLSSAILGLIVINFTVIIIGSSGKTQDNQDPTVEIVKEKIPAGSWFYRLSYGISKRIFIVPGEMVSEWFECIPSKKPYLYGDGYPIIPRLKGVKFVNYDTELYPIIRPEYAARNITGSVNAATFMREYSNFGYAGLVLSSLLIALFIGFIENVFRDNFKMFIIINLIYLFYLSSSNLWTLLFSGGWALSIIIYLVLKPNKTVKYDR